ncbi:glycosyltransferase [Hymenobacter sp. YC55]|uniref:glycosyltransferase n=1 Tax=Hymenobacter sp. YC55 TaxID=3034019 RepID=UPI0023F94829|nr:glycosyltransferase [Hymenobacter sp. YC55]MDF7810187.1 glycosyltransferase [Hymenobacter sp. YC55]
MISVIICSRDDKSLQLVSRNVKSTVGVPYEIIGVDNRKGEYSICQAYNIGASQSKYDILCFMHEDICFHTQEWGSIVEDILSDQTVGVLGVAGSEYQIKAPSSWWSIGAQFNRIQILQKLPGKDSELLSANPKETGLADVAVLDGLWLCSRKDVWLQHKFDEKTFKDFHFYDVDFCASIFPHYRICVTFDILIEHFSNGTINKPWLINALKYQAKYKSALPFGVVSVDKEQNALLEKNATHDFVKRLIDMGAPHSLILSNIVKLASYSLTDKHLVNLIKRYIRNNILKKANVE